MWVGYKQTMGGTIAVFLSALSAVWIHNEIHTHTQIDTLTRVSGLLFALGKYMQPCTCLHQQGNAVSCATRMAPTLPQE